jgi:hypothetical protein
MYRFSKIVSHRAAAEGEPTMILLLRDRSKAGDAAKR